MDTHLSFPIYQRESDADTHQHAHSVQFYDDDAALVKTASSFIGSALGAGGAAIVVGTRGHRDRIAAELHAIGLDLSRASNSGRYVAADAAGILDQVMVDGQLDEDRFSAIIGNLLHRAANARSNADRPVAVFGELVALLAADGAYDAAIDMERCWDDLSEHYPFTLHCGYPMQAFSRPGSAEALALICDAHTDVEPVESFTALPNEDERSRMIVSLQHKAQALEHEIEARMQAEQALHDQNRELQAALAARDEFLAVAAHELRTPVTGLRGNAQLLLRNTNAGRAMKSERVATSLATMERLSRHLSVLVGRMLDATQIEAGTLRIEPEETDLVALARSVIDQQAPQDTHTLSFEGPESLYAVVDSVRFEQVIANLVDNAIKYSPNGGPVQVRVTDNGAGGIEIAVTDSGLGIPMDERDAVFTSFRQAHINARFSGIGLGLFVSRQIVEMHGGSMRIEDPDHPGTTVVVSLPASTEAAPA